MIDLTNLLIDVEDQRHYNSCVGQTLSTVFEAVWFKFTGERVEFSPAFSWMTTKGDLDNTGVIPGVAYVRLKEIGICTEATYPYTDENVSRMPTEAAYKEAKQYRIAKFASIKTPEEVAKYLDLGLPFQGTFRFPSFSHAMAIFGYRGEGEKREWLIVNSWGNEWKEAGKQWMGDLEFRRMFKGGIVITKLPLTIRFAKAFNKLMKVFR